MHNESDEYIISRIVVFDDHKAYRILIERHQGGIRNLLSKLTNFNEEITNDLFQEVLIKMYASLKSFKGNSSLSSWVYRITYNVFIDDYNKNKRRKELIDNLDVKSKLSSGENTEKKIDAEILVSYLKPEEKIAIQLSYLEGYTHKEISKILDCPIGTVKSYIKRGKERIKKNLKS